jgi:hypothetical protein
VKILLTCVFDSSSLTAISESNHTMKQIDIFYVECSDILVTLSDNLRGCIKRLLQLNWIDKILLALQDKDSIIKDLANVSVGLMPEVLALPHRQVDNEFQHRYLNILYSTMRWWNMPMLYLYYHDACVKSYKKVKEMISFLCVDGQCINYVCNTWRDSELVLFSEVYGKLLNGNISFHITHIN